MNPNIAGWYSPSSERFWTAHQAEIALNSGFSIPQDAIPLTYASHTKQLMQLLEEAKRNAQDLTCALESVREDLKKFEDALR